MPISSVGSGGGRDFATMTAWEAAVQASGVDETADCFDDADFTENVIIDGSVGSDDRIIQAAAGERHNGTASGGGCLNNPSGDGNAFTLSDNNCQLIGFIITGVTGASAEGVRVTSTGAVIDACVIEGNPAIADQDGIFQGNDSGVFTTVQNCSIYQWDRAGIHLQNSGSAITASIDSYCNTIWDCDFGIGWRNDPGATTFLSFDVIDTVFVANAVADFGRTPGGMPTLPTITGDFNMDSDGNAFTPGANSLPNRTATDNPSPGAGDFVIFADITTAATFSLLLQVAVDNDAIFAGVGPALEANVPVTDIALDPRVGDVADMGCDEAPTAVVTACTDGAWSSVVTFAACDSYRLVLDGPLTDSVKASVTVEFEEV